MSSDITAKGQADSLTIFQPANIEIIGVELEDNLTILPAAGDTNITVTP